MRVMHVVFLVRHYHPYCSAVGTCVSKVAESLVGRSKVTVVCEKVKLDEGEVDTYRGQSIRRVITKSTARRTRIENSIRGRAVIGRLLGRVALLSIRAFGYVTCHASRDSVRRDLVDQYLNALEEIPDPVDIVVPACMPFEGLLAAARYQETHATVEIVPYLFDKFAENVTLHRTRINLRIKRRRHIQLERSVFEKCARVLYLPSWRDHVVRHFSDLHGRFRSVEHPLITRDCDEDIVHFPEDCTNIVYAGVVTMRGRNPDAAVRIFDAVISRCRNVVMHFYAFGDAREVLAEFANKWKGRVHFHGRVETAVSRSAIKHGSILLSIGNSDITQTPSKVFEYMASCKPIIHVAVYAGDPVCEILSLYPAACVVCLELDSVDEQVRRVEEFVSRGQWDDVEFSAIEERFPSAVPKYSADCILGQRSESVHC